MADPRSKIISFESRIQSREQRSEFLRSFGPIRFLNRLLEIAERKSPVGCRQRRFRKRRSRAVSHRRGNALGNGAESEEDASAGCAHPQSVHSKRGIRGNHEQSGRSFRYTRGDTCRIPELSHEDVIDLEMQGEAPSETQASSTYGTADRFSPNDPARGDTKWSGTAPG